MSSVAVSLLLFFACCSGCEAAVWSVQATNTCIDNNGTFRCPRKTVFYGSYQERILYRKCESLKCDFISAGCVIRQNDPPPSLSCFSILGKMTKADANCPYKPCEGYNSKSVCVRNSTTCLQDVGELQTFGLCHEEELCCLFKTKV